jgi:hypothetical protein
MTSQIRFVLFCSLIAVAVACSSTAKPVESTPTAPPSTAASNPAITEAEVLAVAAQVYPKQNGYYGVCGGNGNLESCPYSDRLKARLQETKQNLVRGAQNPSLTFAASADLVGPNTSIVIAHVVLFEGRMHFDLWITRQGGRVVVDDQICSGRKETSIYANPVVACT